MSVQDPRRERLLSWLLLLFFWGLLLALAATRPLAVPDEGRYGDIGRWMLQSGDWLAPRLDGMPFFQKPPLLHWLQATSMAVFGVHAWSARLVPAVHAGLMMLMLYMIARRNRGEEQARNIVVILGSSLGFLIGGQYVNHDMLVASWIGIAILCFAEALIGDQRPDVRWSLGGFAACALGLLSKGLIGFVLPGAVIFVWLLWTRRLSRLWQLPWLRGIAVFAVIGLPWFVVAQRQYPGLFDYLIIGQHFRRYTGEHYNNQWGAWFYPAVITLMLFPWSLLLWWRALHIRNLVASWRAQGTTADTRWTSLMWIWLLVILVFFSLPKSKLVGYIFPVLPAVTAIVALHFPSWPQLTKQRRARFAGLYGGMMAVSLVLALGLDRAAIPETLKHSSQDVAEFLGCALQPGERVYAREDYPYDLPFVARLQQPLIVVADWPAARKNDADNWKRELYEAADFDPVAATNLQSPAALEHPADGSWLALPAQEASPQLPPGWNPVLKGKAWQLLRFRTAVAEGPPAAQDESLHRCQQ
ncbi:MAG TPA: glycosyltransferase family 39 protein [Candidatus Acidoferrum sp.]|nr:glycosyltransferase family 39 protein [Candidatus Acidoferrum sp.]